MNPATRTETQDGAMKFAILTRDSKGTWQCAHAVRTEQQAFLLVKRLNDCKVACRMVSLNFDEPAPIITAADIDAMKSLGIEVAA